jgi:hypothetical protein
MRCCFRALITLAVAVSTAADAEPVTSADEGFTTVEEIALPAEASALGGELGAESDAPGAVASDRGTADRRRPPVRPLDARNATPDNAIVFGLFEAGRLDAATAGMMEPEAALPPAEAASGATHYRPMDGAANSLFEGGLIGWVTTEGPEALVHEARQWYHAMSDEGQDPAREPWLAAEPAARHAGQRAERAQRERLIPVELLDFLHEYRAWLFALCASVLLTGAAFEILRQRGSRGHGSPSKPRAAADRRAAPERRGAAPAAATGRRSADPRRARDERRASPPGVPQTDPPVQPAA